MNDIDVKPHEPREIPSILARVTKFEPLTPEEQAFLRDYPNLRAVMDGAVSGRSTEWPRVRAELHALMRREITRRQS